ncbi:hypothetical protein BRC94_11305 [Halobacteriales archaeon QS_5_70_17]|nr:MAG: hypothetical protein BRC94_11305 [Halobacteriales archaeon QS_5_70_17]
MAIVTSSPAASARSSAVSRASRESSLPPVPTRVRMGARTAAGGKSVPGDGRHPFSPLAARRGMPDETPDADPADRPAGAGDEESRAGDDPTGGATPTTADERARSERRADGSPDPDPDADPDADASADSGADPADAADVPEDVRKYARFKKMDGARYERANDFLRERTYITAREWAIARLCSDFRTETGVEMTKIGENLPELVPFMEDTYTPQAVNQARAAFEEKVRKAGATFLYGAMCDFFTAEQLDDVMYESTEVAKFLLEVEGVDLSVEEELEAEERISSVMREVREASAELREEEGSGVESESESESESSDADADADADSGA